MISDDTSGSAACSLSDQCSPGTVLHAHLQDLARTALVDTTHDAKIAHDEQSGRLDCFLMAELTAITSAIPTSTGIWLVRRSMASTCRSVVSRIWAIPRFAL